MPIRVAIADDHQVLIEGLSLLLRPEQEVELIGHANNGIQLLKLLKDNPADVVLLDINMSGMGGLETCRRLRRDFPETQVLALTMYDKGSMVRQMLNAGAAGYLLKNTGREELLLAIRTVAEGKPYLSPAANQALLDHLRHGASSREGIQELTRREKQVLKLVAREMTTQEIAEELHISFNTVDTHRKNLLGKLGAKNTAGLIRIAMENGLL